MCLPSVKTPTVTPAPPAPTPVQTGESEAVLQARNAERKRLQQAAGYQSTMLSPMASAQQPGKTTLG
jgi:hypothetical protein